MANGSSRADGKGGGMPEIPNGLRDNLVGYLLNSLDEAERAEVDAARQQPEMAAALERDLTQLRRVLEPLRHDAEPIEPPAGLAQRTIAAARQAPPSGPVLSPAADSVPAIRQRAWVDRFMLAAAAVAAVILVAPLLREALDDARALRAARNLNQVGRALHGYADAKRLLPSPPAEGPLSRAGLYAPTLVSAHRLTSDAGVLVYPGSSVDTAGGPQIPTLEEVEAAVGTDRFQQVVERMGGDYGYTLGHRAADGMLQPIRDRRRGDHPLMADAPDASGERSSNHPEGIHHILYEDGRVERIVVTEDGLNLLHRDDHLYRNHDGKIAAGKDVEDAVIGDSHHQP